ncbi:MAG: hydrogenase nickel incorporation protein HypB [Dehalococcoidales bacterium]|nr:hydrogenase nickel incorporation protein HypB [Dehalococcoidales bacterium]
MKIKVLRDILGANEQIARKNRELLEKNKVFAVNIMASPGAGKTSLVLQTIKALRDKVKVGVIEGDISSSIDAQTVGKEGVPVVQINTGGECHLDANMIQNALNNLPLKEIDLLLIENVGNLVCPAEFNLGEHRKVLVASVPEGDDKPHKYPLMFTTVDAVVLNKTDLLPYVKFNTDAFTKAVKGINAKVAIFPVSCTTGNGIPAWSKWLKAQMRPARNK